MKVFLLLCLIGIAFAYEDPLKAILRSPKATLNLYSSYKTNENIHYSATEDRMRFRLFRSNAEMIADANSGSDSAVLGLNLFSSMTPAEKKQWLGLNITGRSPNNVVLESTVSLDQVPTEKLWTNEGKVTAVKNQGGCGSCWTFGAVGGLETRYAEISGVLRDFSEEEYLDCVYDIAGRDGCRGGWPNDAYMYSAARGGQLCASKYYKYFGIDAMCLSAYFPNAAIAASIDGVFNVGATEDANIQALASGSLSVAFEVTKYFQQYESGTMRDGTCFGRPNHAVTAVGYTEHFVLVKNSWGENWGEEGFVKFARGYPNCGLFQYSSYPRLTVTGVVDSDPADKATPYRPSTDPDPVPDSKCKDNSPWCNQVSCGYDTLYDENACPLTCRFCKPDDKDGDDKDGECASGTVRCPDGVCRHTHMC